MIGAIADPCVKIISPPKITSIINIGISQNFFLDTKNIKNSFKDLIVKIAVSLYPFLFHALSNMTYCACHIFCKANLYLLFS